jgi:hypothetical protein
LKIFTNIANEKFVNETVAARGKHHEILKATEEIFELIAALLEDSTNEDGKNRKTRYHVLEEYSHVLLRVLMAKKIYQFSYKDIEAGISAKEAHEAEKKFSPTDEIYSTIKDLSKLGQKLIKNCNSGRDNEGDIMKWIANALYRLRRLREIYGFANEDVLKEMRLKAAQISTKNKPHDIAEDGPTMAAMSAPAFRKISEFTNTAEKQ